MDVSQAMTAGAPLEFQVRFDFLRVLAMPQADLLVQYYRGNRVVHEASSVGAGYGERSRAEVFDKVVFLSAAGGLLHFVTREGADVFNDEPPTGSVEIVQGSAVVNIGAAVVGVAASLLAAAVAGTKSLRFLNNGGADVFLGAAGVTVAGGAVRIRPGEIWVERDASAAAWYGISGTAGQDVRVQRVS